MWIGVVWRRLATRGRQKLTIQMIAINGMGEPVSPTESEDLALLYAGAADSGVRVYSMGSGRTAIRTDKAGELGEAQGEPGWWVVEHRGSLQARLARSPQAWAWWLDILARAIHGYTIGEMQGFFTPGRVRVEMGFGTLLAWRGEFVGKAPDGVLPADQCKALRKEFAASYRKVRAFAGRQLTTADARSFLDGYALIQDMCGRGSDGALVFWQDTSADSDPVWGAL